MYDIIGDIHGHAEPLKALLSKMGYHKKGGVWQHPTRKCLFVGDYIDRGPAIRESLSIVKNMTDNGQAIALMGNHEFNALAYHYKKTDGTYLRPHKPSKVTQHAQTLAQFYFYREDWDDYLQWFYKLPLFIELDGIRVVHACWDDEHMNALIKNEELLKINNEGILRQSLAGITGGKTIGVAFLSEELLVRAHDPNTKEFKIIEDILKGKEVAIPPDYKWQDKDGHWRWKNRVKWWVDPKGTTHGKLLFQCPEVLQDVPVGDIEFKTYPADAPPVFFGHYWLPPGKPEIMSHNVICLDYSVAKEGHLVAYRWTDGEPIDQSNFVYV